MKSDEYLWKVCKEIYKKMYKESNPAADFDKLIETGEAKQKDFYMKYYLSIEKQKEIIDEICKNYKLKGYDERKVNTTVHLGSSPNSSEKTWKEHISAN